MCKLPLQSCRFGPPLKPPATSPGFPVAVVVVVSVLSTLTMPANIDESAWPSSVPFAQKAQYTTLDDR